MALQKTVVNIPLIGGLDTKTAPNLVTNAKMAIIQNARFIQGANGAKQKRNGYNQLSQRDQAGNLVLNGSSLATWNNQLLAFDGLGHAYSWPGSGPLSGVGEAAGMFQPSSVFAQFEITENSIAKDITNNIAPASATANGVTAYAYLSAQNGLTISVFNEATGQRYMTSSFGMTFTSIAPRVITDGTLIYVFAMTPFGLQCSKVTPTSPQGALAFAYVDAAPLGPPPATGIFDVGYLATQNLFCACYTNATGTLKFSVFGSNLIVSSSAASPFSDAGISAINLQVLGTGATTAALVAWAGGGQVFATVFGVASGAVSYSTNFVVDAAAMTVPLIAQAAPGGTFVAGTSPATIYYQVEAQGGALRQIRTAVLVSTGISQPGAVFVRNAALGANAFIQGGAYFLPIIFESSVQPTYFLLSATYGSQAVVQGKWLPDDAGAFSTLGVLPPANLIGVSKWSIACPELISAEAQNGQVQFVTGVTELVLDFTQTRTQGVQLGQTLQLSGSLPRVFAGGGITEQGFCNYPDSCVATVLNDYANGVFTQIGSGSSISIINLGFPSVNNGSAATNIGTGQTYDAQFLIPANWTAGQPGTYFLMQSELNITGIGLYYFWFNVSGQTDPNLGAPYVGYEIAINSTDSAQIIATKVAAAITASAFGISFTGTIVAGNNEVTITSPANTTLLQPTFRTQFSIYNEVQQLGLFAGLTPNMVHCPPGNCIVPGSFFTFGNASYPGHPALNGYAIWFTVDGQGSAPTNVATNTLVNVSVSSSDSGSQVATKLSAALVMPGILHLGGYQFGPFIEVFWYTDNAPFSIGTMLSSGLGTGAGSGESPGTYATDAYEYSWIYEAVDTAGQIYRSEPSVPILVGLPSWGPLNDNSYYIVQLTVPNLQVTNRANGTVSMVGYRTTGDQSNFFRITPPNAPLVSLTTADSTTFVDQSSDVVINGNDLLYTTGGVLENDQAPAMSFLCVHQDRLWGISDEDPYLLFYTKQFAAGLEVAWSIEQTVRIDPSGGVATSLASMDGNLIVFAQYRIWTITGAGPNISGTGSGFNLPQLVSTEVGCRDPFSVVLTRDGLIFKSSKGFYLLDRSSQVNPLPDLEGFNADVVTAATLIPSTTEIRFLSASGTTQLYDTLFKEWGSFTNHQGVDACIYAGTYYYLRVPANQASTISIFQETPNQPNIVPLDNGVAFPMVLATNAIKGADIAAAAGNSGAAVQSFGRIWKNLWKGNFQGVMQVTCTYDYGTGGQTSESHLIGAGNTDFWGSDPLWGGSTPWGGSGTTAAFYQFKCYNRNQLCESIQLTIQDVAPYCAWTVDALALEVGIRKGAYKRLGIGQST